MKFYEVTSIYCVCLWVTWWKPYFGGLEIPSLWVNKKYRKLTIVGLFSLPNFEILYLFSQQSFPCFQMRVTAVKMTVVTARPFSKHLMSLIYFASASYLVSTIAFWGFFHIYTICQIAYLFFQNFHLYGFSCKSN